MYLFLYPKKRRKYMNVVKVALLQLLPEENLQGNIIKGIKAVEKAAAMGADIALFPEMWSCGYCFLQDKTALDSLAVSHESEYTMTFASDRSATASVRLL